MPELYQPNIHVGVRLPLESTKVSFANTISNVLTLRAATFHVTGFQTMRKETLGVTSLSSTCSPVAHEDEGLHAVMLFVVNSDIPASLVLCNL